MSEIEALETIVACADVAELTAHLEAAARATADTDTYHRLMRIKTIVTIDLAAIHDRLEMLSRPVLPIEPIPAPQPGETPPGGGE